MFAELAVLINLLPAQQPAARDTVRLSPVTVRESATRAYRAERTRTATKTELSLRETPASVAVVTNTLIADQSMQNLADAVRYVPGVTMGQGEGHRDAPTIRGNSSTSDFFVDGVRDDAQYFRDLYNLQRLEVLSGPNAMIFGRGGGGGVMNRVTRQAEWTPAREIVLEGGAFGHGRGTLDIGNALGDAFAGRVNAMFQRSGGFRDRYTLERGALNPTVAWRFSEATVARAGFEYFEDQRRVDRGLPSFQGLPSPAPLAVFFGNPDSSYADAQVGTASATLEHQMGERLSFRSHSRFTSYDKFYQNVLPGAVNPAGTDVSLSAYSNDTQRENLFSQNEASIRFASAGVSHSFLLGAEIGRQYTDNLRLTGYFNGTATSLSVPFDSPTIGTPVEFRAAASDASNTTVASVAALYAQDQLRITERAQATFGVRVERFALDYRNHRNGERLQRTDDVVSPRLGIVYSVVAPLSVYASYGVSHLPASGDQFASLSVTTQTLEPERFANAEIGAKWEPRPALSINGAVYELLRTNTAAPSALDPGVTVQTGRQRTHGLEVTVNGEPRKHWSVAGTFTTQGARIISRTAAAPAGAVVPLVPERSFSLWNRVQITSALGIGAGVVSQSRMFAAIDNSVTLPGFWRADAAAFVQMTRAVSFQLNVENALDATYYPTSHGNNNIMPGSPRTLRLSLRTRW